tara:strand:+ start:662 stop:856 length:195 start_codon:yes stop_codon:yes gene_type:complete
MNIKSVKKFKEWDGLKYVDNSFGGYLVIDTNNQTSAIPNDPANSDYQEVLKWAAIDGNNIEEAD